MSVRSCFLPFHQPLIDEDDERAVLEVLRSGWITTGPRTKGFEKTLAAYVGTTHAVGVNSCTAALSLALEAGEAARNVLLAARIVRREGTELIAIPLC